MGMVDELRGLQELRDAGTLTEAEFAQAKAALLSGGAPRDRRRRHRAGSSGSDETLGAAANTWVRFQIRWAIAMAIVMAIFFFVFFLPGWK